MDIKIILAFSLILLEGCEMRYVSMSSGMKCSYGERGSLTATCENVTAQYFKTTSYRFDSLDETLNCINCNLGSVPPNTFDLSGNHVRTLNLTKSNITSLSDSAFMGLVQLRNLYLPHNFIPNIVPGIFRGVQRISYIDLSHNAITLLARNAFSELHNLTELQLSNNVIKNIDSSAFDGLGALLKLDLHNNNIKDLSDAFLGLNSLHTLNLQNNSIEELKPEQINITSLGVLNLSQNKIKSIPPNVFSGLVNLISLKLASNGIQSIEVGAFRKLNSLEYLDLENNDITNFEFATFVRLHNLRDLHIPYNKLNALEFSKYSAMPELRYINVSHNNIKLIIPGNVLKLHNLHTLDISYNFITYIDYDDIHIHAPVLVHIDLEHNNLPCYLVEDMIDYFQHELVMLTLDDTYANLKETCNKTIIKDDTLEAKMSKLEALSQTPKESSGNFYVVYTLIFVLMALVCAMGYVQFKMFKTMQGGNARDIAEVGLITSRGLEHQDDY